MEEKLQYNQCKYEDVVIPDRKLEEIRSKFGDLSQKGLHIVLDYLNWDKYLLIQGTMKTINNKNTDGMIYLDGALSRIDGLISTIGSFIKKENKSEII